MIVNKKSPFLGHHFQARFSNTDQNLGYFLDPLLNVKVFKRNFSTYYIRMFIDFVGQSCPWSLTEWFILCVQVSQQPAQPAKVVTSPVVRTILNTAQNPVHYTGYQGYTRPTYTTSYLVPTALARQDAALAKAKDTRYALLQKEYEALAPRLEEMGFGEIGSFGMGNFGPIAGLVSPCMTLTFWLQFTL